MKDFTQGNSAKQIFDFTIPMLLGSVLQLVYTITDSIIVGHYLGSTALAAVGASFPIIFVLISLAVGVTMGGTILISQYFGANNMDKIKKTIDTLFIFLFVSSLLITYLGIQFSDQVFSVMKLPSEVIPEAKEYLHIYFLGIIFFFGFHGSSAILKGFGDSKTPLYFMLISTIVNVVLNLVFIVWFKWGVGSSATATIISQAFAFIAMTIYLNKTHPYVILALKKLEFDKDIFIKSMQIGLPTGFQQMFVGLGMMAMYWIVNPFGTAASAAFTVVGRIDTIAYLPAMNFSVALTTFVGQNIGANQFHRVKVGVWQTWLMASSFSLVISVVAFLFSKELIQLFTNNIQVITIGSSYLKIVSLFYLFFSTMFIFHGVLRGAGDTLIPMFITLFALWIFRLPTSYYLSKYMGTDGIWWGIPLAWFIGFLFSYLYYLTGKWKKKRIL